MKGLSIIALGAGVLASLLLLGGGGWAAGPTQVELQVEPEVGLGERVTARVAVRDEAGKPVAGAGVVLLSPASFGPARGEMRLGQVKTNAQGQAIFTYQARREGQQTLVARFLGDSRYAPGEASAAFTVRGSAQLYEERAGVKLPGVGVWILIVLLMAFWSVFLVVMALITLIAREGQEALEP